ncbi:DUF2164 domain-containing protein [Scopulibacillus cellulosilyticus]|uniref:DUF2164 domain-containing protein n=1 Tax=Scopulibacillus cellulosilyticus TaxID=2665665 RepID=A0ABW2PTQ6_9BACL
MNTVALTQSQKELLINKLQGYFFSERHEELGLIGAENLLDFFLKECAPLVYNTALKDAKHVIDQQFASLEEEIYILEKR